MSHQLENETVDLANLRLRLRGDLAFELQEHGDDSCYVIHDEVSSNYFQIGLPEYTFISVLDGNTTLQLAVEQTATRLGHDALSIREAIRIAHWLLETGLAQAVNENGTPMPDADLLIEKVETRQEQTVASQLNPLFIRVPLFNPHRLFKTIYPVFGWIQSAPFFAIWCLSIVYALICIAQQPGNLISSAQGLMTNQAWLWLLLTLVGLKLVHELAHGLFCHGWGGHVKKTGLVFILFVPMPYVDVTSCWGFQSKWRRIGVSAAGMYVEVFLAAIAAIIWSFSHDEVTRFHLFNVMLLGSLTTLLFNANFLMRFDGYYIVSDVLEIPNLYQKGQQYVNQLGRRYLLGMKARTNLTASARDIWIRVYGVTSLIWRWMIYVSLTLVATALFHGFGLALAMVGIAVWLGQPIARLLSSWNDPTQHARPNFTWLGSVTVPLLATATFATFWLPWPVQVTAPAMVEYDAIETVRPVVNGFVASVHVENNQFVHKGELLVELENRELELRLIDLRLEREKSLIRSRLFHEERKLASYQAEAASREALEKQIAEIRTELDSLKLRAPVDGVILGGQLQELTGQYVVSGASLMRIIDPGRKKVVASIEQEHFSVFDSNQNQLVKFIPRFGTDDYFGILGPINPSTVSVEDKRLTCLAGGSIDARAAATSDLRSANATQRKKGVELLAPRFAGEVSLDRTAASQLKVGLVGDIRLNQYDSTIAENLVILTRRVLQKYR